MCESTPRAIVQGLKLTVPNVPGDPTLGQHIVLLAKELYIDRADFKEVSVCSYCHYSFIYI